MLKATENFWKKATARLREENGEGKSDG